MDSVRLELTKRCIIHSFPRHPARCWQLHLALSHTVYATICWPIQERCSCADFCLQHCNKEQFFKDMEEHSGAAQSSSYLYHTNPHSAMSGQVPPASLAPTAPLGVDTTTVRTWGGKVGRMGFCLLTMCWVVHSLSPIPSRSASERGQNAHLLSKILTQF